MISPFIAFFKNRSAIKEWKKKGFLRWGENRTDALKYTVNFK